MRHRIDALQFHATAQALLHDRVIKEILQSWGPYLLALERGVIAGPGRSAARLHQRFVGVVSRAAAGNTGVDIAGNARAGTDVALVEHVAGELRASPGWRARRPP